MTIEQLAILPFVLHFALVVFLYAWLTFLRQKSVMKKEVAISDYVNANADGETSKRVSRNLANQFEIPIFAYLAIAVLALESEIQIWDIVAAWVFFLGRLLHTFVQTMTKNVPLRGQVFTINFVGVLWLVGHMFWALIN